MAEPSHTARVPVVDGPLPLSKGYEQLTTLNVAAQLTVPDGTSMVLLQAEAQDIRWRADGVDPTSSVGMLLTAGRDMVYPASKTALEALRFIQVTPGAKINVTYY